MSTIQFEIKEFINHCNYEKNLSNKTIKAYSIDISQFTKFLIENNSLTYPVAKGGCATNK